MRETLKVKGMSCAHCVSSIEEALKEQNVKAKVDLVSKTVEVEYTEAVSRNVIIEEIEDLGYEVQ